MTERGGCADNAHPVEVREAQALRYWAAHPESGDPRWRGHRRGCAAGPRGSSLRATSARL